METDSATKHGGPVRKLAAICGRRGSVLILALWSMSLLTVFAVSLGYMVRQKVTLLDRIEKRDLLWNAAWSGVEKARSAVKADADLQSDNFQEDWANNPTLFREIEFERARISVEHERLTGEKKVTVYGLSDEQGKLNLNFAQPAAVSLILQQVTTLSAEEANPVAYAIVDWRDGDSAYGHPDMGAEDSDYDDLPQPYEAKDRPYETMDELLLVKGMNRAIFEKLKPFVTVFGTDLTNLNTTSREVLVALGLPMGAADKLIRHRDGGDGVAGTSDDKPFLSIDTVTQDMALDEPPLSDIERVAVDNLVGSGKMGVGTGAFGVTSIARSPDGRAELTIEAVIDHDAQVLYCRTTGFRWHLK